MKVENHLTRDESALRRQLVVTLRDVDGLTWAAIGRRIGVTGNRAHQIYCNARRTLMPNGISNSRYVYSYAELATAELLRAKRSKQMQIVIMREVDKATFREIGVRFGVSIERARQQYKAAKIVAHKHYKLYLFSALVNLLAE